MGKFLAVDLGGSNCRICLVDLHGDSTFTSVQTTRNVPTEVMVNSSYKPLFAFIAEQISTFLRVHCDSNKQELPYRLGFTFSFTCEQTSIAGGTLVHWDKGWDIPEAIGKDPCAMLQEAIDNLNLPVLVSVLANDSVGALLTRAYTLSEKGSTLGSIIFGTGTNAAYVEQLSKVRRLGTEAASGGTMLMNTEWGCFDEELSVLPTTPYDDELDANSADAGSQLFEKRVSGMYLGEMLRLVILKLVNSDDLNLEVAEESPVFQRGAINSSFLSELANDKYDDSQKAAELIMNTLSIANLSHRAAKAIRYLASAIVQRAARLAGASLAAIIIQSGRLDEASQSSKFSKTHIHEEQLKAISKSSLSIFQRFVSHLGMILHKIFISVRMSIFVPPRWSSAAHIVIVDPSGSEQEEVIDIGADGSVIESYPGFEDYMRGAMRDVPEIGQTGEKRIQIGLVKDGSGVGAALMAQVASQNTQ